MRTFTSFWRRIWLAACSMNSGWPSSTINTARLPLQNLDPFFRYERVGDIEHVERQLAAPERIGATEQLERAQRVVVQAALQDDADVARLGIDDFVELALGDESQRRRQALLDLFPLLRIGRGRQNDAAVVPRGRRQRVGGREGRPAVVLRLEAAVNMACADAQHEHDRRVAGFRSSKPCSTARTIAGRCGRGSRSHICDFIAKACVRSCMMLAPSP